MLSNLLDKKKKKKPIKFIVLFYDFFHIAVILLVIYPLHLLFCLVQSSLFYFRLTWLRTSLLCLCFKKYISFIDLFYFREGWGVSILLLSPLIFITALILRIWGSIYFSFSNSFIYQVRLFIYSIEIYFHPQSPPQLGVVFALAPPLHSFWSYFSIDLQQHIGHLLIFLP